MGVVRFRLWAPATEMAALLPGSKPIIHTNFVNTDSVMGFPRSSSFCRHTTLRTLRDDLKLERLKKGCIFYDLLTCSDTTTFSLKTRSRMMKAIRFSRQNDASSRARTT